jgi:hypothetical protein
MTRLVVIEGPDGGGKSTLAKAIQDRYGFGYRHEGPPPKGADPLLYYQARLFDAMLEALRTKGVVLDRFALGERVYGPLLRGADNLGDAGWGTIDRCLQAVGAVQIVCLPDYDTCRAAWAARNAAKGELVTDEVMFRKTWLEWYRVTTQVWRPDPRTLHFVYDWTRRGVLDELIRNLK